MRRDEAQQLLQVAQDELGGIPAAHQQHVLNTYAELYGFEEAQLSLDGEAPPPSMLPERMAQAPKARSSDPAPSHHAALDNAPRRESQRGRIIELLATMWVGKAWLAEEISDQTGIPLNSVSTRMSELVTGGWADPKGPKRQTKHGEMATTYVPTPKALAHFREQVDQALKAA